MLTRRHIRLKIMQIIYALKISDFEYTKETEKKLLESIDSSYNLYLILISLLIEILNRAQAKYLISQKKLLSDQKNIYDNKKFIKNQLLNLLKSDHLFNQEINKRNSNLWDLDFKYIDLIYEKLIKSELFSDYIKSDEISFKNDRDFVAKFYKNIIATNDKLYSFLEDRNINWVDDFPLINTIILKLINKSKETNSKTYFLPKLYKDNQDKIFAKDLLKKTLKNYNDYNNEISKKTKNWDADRIARLDYVMLNMALCELIEFKTIPIKVTLNEYIEISKEYSTPKSNVFINGILDSIAKDFIKSGKIIKEGRGLQE
ncbi:MAG: transcription antitermination factor NusB [Flavobacteriaceae bacterium]|jgi:transcription antitermination protein NusB|nr:transcription antitermination factor NusB [Flavobacteriaceae bacterium]MBT4112391.1 transcription antitermination factor NusB [Flavobacteriaceae bacterium]MBT4614245.1 transcription antitermination factor NusB [Flavobacteriaceae bacterium]MBT5246698.1 transcription antitermination factor NusB [Flavobacteriaceae bacterium]MBT5649883.1 transcription antitermination factor NusB [Flavobacteriaceae bacterium]